MLPVYIILVYLCLALNKTSGIGDSTAIQFLQDSETKVSPNGTYKLGFFSPPNNTNRYLGISYNKVSPINVVWVANRNNPVLDSSGILRISEGGILEIVNSRNDTFWSFNLSSPAPNVNRDIQLLETGNLRLIEFDTSSSNSSSNGRVLWQSFDYPTDALLPSMTITVKNTNTTRLHAWQGPSNPSEGRFTLGLDSSTNPQLVLWDGEQRHYRSGPWNGNLFLGMIYTDPTNNYADTYIQKNDALGEVTLIYTGISEYSFSHYYFSYDGSLSEIWWDSGKRSWQTVYKVPEDQCDFYGKCGAFGICNSQKSPICQCLRGFIPKNTAEWNSGNWSSGCVRRTPLQCGIQGTQTNGFLVLKTVKLPDLELWLQGVNPNDCRNLCLNNCSCVAYAYDAGAGCMYWNKDLIDIQQFTSGGISLNLRLAHSELGNKSKKAVIAAVVTAGTGLIIGLIILWIWFNRRKAEKEANRKNILEHLKRGDHKTQRKVEELPLIDFKDLAAATDNFHDNQMLGQGGFGQVYKGTLEGQEIAVKRLSAASSQGVDEFMNEVVVISRLQHKNLVSLIGFCVEGEEKLLVYEYMPNKSLDAFVFDPTKRKLLDWHKRFNIIEGICRGLIYLHRDSRLRIIHRDLKASNILLDENLNAKIADFGMARIFGHGQDQDETRRVVGTYGYMSPEYAMDGHFSEKSDVYSFGVLLLEILTAEKNNAFWYEEESLTLLGYVWKLWAEGDVVPIIDPVIFDTLYKKDIERSMQVGLLCVQENVNERPSMSTVMSMLSSDIADLPRPKQPGFNKRHMFMDTTSSPLHQISGDQISFTAVSGR